MMSPERSGQSDTCDLRGRGGALSAAAFVVFCVHCLVGWGLDSAASWSKDALWRGGWDLPLAHFLTLHLLLTVPLALGNVGLVLVACRLSGISADDIGWRRPPRVLASVCVGLAAALVLHYVVFGLLPEMRSILALHRIPEWVPTFDWTSSRLANPQAVNRLLFSWTLYPLAEELVFRGYIDAALSRVISSTWSLVVVATLFALSHWRVRGGVGPGLLYDAWLFGIALGVIRRRTGSLLAPVLTHCATSLLGVLFVWQSRMF